MSNVFLAPLKTENFNPMEDKIAVVVKEFTLLKKADIFKYSEPYIISLAIDELGINNPAIEFNALPFPRMRKGDTIVFDGQGHLIYGPKNPGEFLAYTVLFMESDKDVRDFGKAVEEIVTSEAVKMGAKTLLTAVPQYGTAVNVLSKLVELIAQRLGRDKDDFLYRRSGTLLRDVVPPYDILRTYKRSNDFIEANISVIPLIESNNLGEACKQIALVD